MADALQELTVFARIVGTGSLSAAARDLGMSPALVSRRLASLETRLGVRLVNRTTRSLHLTDEGAAYYETCSRVLADIQEADATVSAGRADPRGILRVAAPASFGNQHVAPLVPKFAERYPEIAIIFYNLHSMHDVVSDVLASPEVQRNRKRAEILSAIFGCDQRRP